MKETWDAVPPYDRPEPARTIARSRAPVRKQPGSGPDAAPLFAAALAVAVGLDEADTAAILLALFGVETLREPRAPGLAKAAARYGRTWVRGAVGTWFGPVGAWTERPRAYERASGGDRPRLFLVVAGAGIEPATYRFSGDRSYQLSYPATQPLGLQAVLTGFEPAASTLTGWRALQTAPQDQAIAAVSETSEHMRLYVPPTGFEPVLPP